MPECYIWDASCMVPKTHVWFRVNLLFFQEAGIHGLSSEEGLV